MEEGGKKPDRRDVNAIWQQLNASRPASNRDFDKLWHGFSSDISRSNKPCSSSTQDTAKKQAQQLKLDPLIGKLAVVRQTSASQEQQQKLAPPTDLEGAALDRLVQALQSPDANVRKAALHQVQVAFVSRTPPPSAEDVAEALSCKLGKALLRRFEDKSEACREAAVSTFNAMLQAGADATLSLLPYAIPVLEERLFIQQGQGSAEPSEEVRLLLLQLLGVIVAQAGSAVAAYASEVWSVLSAGLADSFHEAAEQACRTVQQLAGCLGMRLSTISKDIVAALLPLTTHKRHRTRIAAIEALRDVMHLGAHEAILDMVGWRDPNVVPIRAFYGDDLKVNYCGKLATDHHPQVRLAFLGMVGSWLLTLRERLDHQPRLLPYLLSGLCDESPAVVQAAVQLLEQLGEQYEQEHENDLADLIRFGGQAQHANEAAFLQALQQGAVAYKAATAAAGQSTHSEEEPNAAAAVFIVPGPFSQRPRIGSRLVISNNFSVALHALCAELSSWQSGPRAMSASLLRVNLVLTESAAERHLQVLLPALCASVRDEDAGPAVADCAALLGCHCSLQLLLELLEPRALDASAEAKKQADVLLVLEAVLRGAGPVGRLRGHSQQLLRLLADPSTAGSQDSHVNAAATAALQQLLVPGVLQQLLLEEQEHGSDTQEQQVQPQQQRQQLVPALVQLVLELGAVNACLAAPVQCSDEPDSSNQQHAEQMLTALAAAAGYGTTDDLLASCRSQLLTQMCTAMDLDSSTAVAAVCRLLLPSSCAWVLTAAGKGRYIGNRQLLADQQLQSTLPAASSLLSGSASSSMAAQFGSADSTTSTDQPPLPLPRQQQQQQQQLGGFASATAAAACRPPHLLELLKLLARAERCCSKQQQQQTPPIMRLLHATLDCCMLTWPAAAFAPQVLQHLLAAAVPALLGSARSLSAMAGLRALHIAMQRGLLEVAAAEAASTGHGCTDKQQQQQQRTAPGAAGVLVVEQLCALVEPVCLLLKSPDLAVRLEACHVLGAMLDVAPAQSMQTITCSSSSTAPAAEASAGLVPALAAAMDDANAEVQAAAAAVLSKLAP